MSDNLAGRVETLEVQQETLATAMADVSAHMKVLTKNTSELIDIFNLLRDGVKLLIILGRMAKWLTIVSIPFAAILGYWASVKSGQSHLP
jgi:hypothetical protein